MTTAPVWWYANRGTGVVLLLLFTLVLVLGQWSAASRAGWRRLPAFVAQGLHRSATLLAAILLVIHVVSAVVDDFVDIQAIDLVIPFRAEAYRTVPLGLGTLALDLVLVVVASSLLRHRVPERAWRVLHTLAYPCWLLAVVHTLGIGTDVGAPVVRGLVIGCITVVTVGLVASLVARPRAVRA